MTPSQQLVQFVEEGTKLLHRVDHQEGLHYCFLMWVHQIGDWIKNQDRIDLYAKWASLTSKHPFRPFFHGSFVPGAGCIHPTVNDEQEFLDSHKSLFLEFREDVSVRLSWLSENATQLSQGQTIETIENNCNSDLVFVIMSFCDEMEMTFDTLVDCGKLFDLNVKRIKDEHGDYRITDKLLEMIATSRFVIADLTKERPNVYFELGYSRALKKNALTIAQSGTRLHFDVYDSNCIFYESTESLFQQLTPQIKHLVST